MLREIYGLLLIIVVVRVFLFIPYEPVCHNDAHSQCNREQLESYLNHARLLSTSMPAIRNPMPRTNNMRTIPHVGLYGSNNSYSGAKTIMSVPASRKASPIISSVNFLV